MDTALRRALGLGAVAAWLGACSPTPVSGGGPGPGGGDSGPSPAAGPDAAPIDATTGQPDSAAADGSAAGDAGAPPDAGHDATISGSDSGSPALDAAADGAAGASGDAAKDSGGAAEDATSSGLDASAADAAPEAGPGAGADAAADAASSEAGGAPDGGSPGPDASSSPVIRLAAGHHNVCALMADGKVRCWGENGGGTLGQGVMTSPRGPSDVVGITNAIDISGTAQSATGSGEHICAVLADHTLQCWGTNREGQLGNGGTTDEYTPVAVSGLSNVTAVGVGGDFTCAVVAGGAVSCWGYNADGELGNGTLTGNGGCTGGVCVLAPATISGLSGVTKLAGGTVHMCALVGDGSMRCWGSRSLGQLGDAKPNGTTVSVDSPVPVSPAGISGVTSFAAGGNNTCAVVGTAGYCWGDNQWGQNGNGLPGVLSVDFTPVSTSAIGSVQQIAVGTNFACGLLADQTVSCWGANATGELAQPASGPSSCVAGSCSGTAQPVAGVTSVVQIVAGDNFVCALLSDGGVKCWGATGSNQLGNGCTIGPDLCQYSAACSVSPTHVVSDLFQGYTLPASMTAPLAACTAPDAGASSTDGGATIDSGGSGGNGDGGSCLAVPSYDYACGLQGYTGDHMYSCTNTSPPSVGCHLLGVIVSGSGSYCCP